MPNSGPFEAAVGSLGQAGLRRLANDIGLHFNVEYLDIVNRIGRTTGKSGGFGPFTIRVR